MSFLKISRSSIDKLYTCVLALSLSLHIFNMGGGDSFKPFYVTALIAALITFLFAPKTYTFRQLVAFLICVLISVIISMAVGVMKDFINLLIILLCCYGVSCINIDSLFKMLMFLIPIDLMALLYEAVTNPIYRFQGFYNDPNYLCTTLIVFFFICLMAYIRYEKKLIRIMILADCVVIVVLIVFTLSRTGLACISLLLLSAFASSIKKHLLKVCFILMISMVALFNYASEFIEQEYDLVYERIFENRDNFESAGELRSELSKQNLRFIADHPLFAFFGLGPSTTGGEVSKQIPGLAQYRKSDLRDHNTWTSCLSEYGLFALFFMSVMIVETVIYIKKENKSSSRYISFVFCFSMIIFSLSIWQMTYLPFWWGIFLLNNKQLLN